MYRLFDGKLPLAKSNSAGGSVCMLCVTEFIVIFSGLALSGVGVVSLLSVGVYFILLPLGVAKVRYFHFTHGL